MNIFFLYLSKFPDFCHITYGSSCFLLIPRKMMWHAARQHCESIDGRLAEIVDAELNDLIKDMWEGNTIAYISLYSISLV